MKVFQVLTFVLTFVAFSATAQIKFKLSYNMESQRYTVSLIPSVTYNDPQNITGTGQITIKVPTNQFIPVDIKSHLLNTNWEANSRNDSPTEAPDFDYISFGLIIQGVVKPNYQQGVEMPLFSFQNAFGCVGKIYIVDNANDPFMPPNSENANIGNTLTILGAGGDAYSGLINGGLCDCNDAGGTTDTKEQLSFKGARVFPNPAVDLVNVSIRWQGAPADASLIVVDAAGKKVAASSLSLTNGENREKILVSDFAPGAYMVTLQGKDWMLSLDKFTKQ